ncbi:uncharacterized mitochondrial protein AtMg00310-like [Coffea arabica]|uniref:Uncharacterized mitochondrial protein AtMg00310-like n=1 Tax=Coffea arabica TaxID=13443 RepID=A0A6P6SG05_COFAR|nr:uncharacterized protein LOC113691080 [Coffea arabica]
MARLTGWKEKLLSQAGNEVLIKSVLLAMPTYAMACCKLPKGLCVEVCKEMAKFWWEDKGQERRVHWMGWSKLSEVKGKGGLGFRDLMDFNNAMLAKKFWRILTRPNLMVSRILRGKYFKGESIWKMKIKASDSWMWKSILYARELLESGVRKRVVDGTTIDIWRDRWLLRRGKE